MEALFAGGSFRLPADGALGRQGDLPSATARCGEVRSGQAPHRPPALTRKLKELRVEARRRMHTPIVLQYQWLCSVLRGHFVYFGLPSNFDRTNDLLSRDASSLVSGTQSPQPAAVLMGAIRPAARTPSLTYSLYHPSSTGGRLLTRANLGRSRVRENSLFGSVRVKPNGRTTRPPPAEVSGLQSLTLSIAIPSRGA
jgi:hypothetical protein